MPIAELIEEIAPKAVITMHSRHPGSQDTRGVYAYHPQKGETATVSSILAAAKHDGNCSKSGIGAKQNL
jgi:hypothetical protein